jgi:hypothetical protein
VRNWLTRRKARILGLMAIGGLWIMDVANIGAPHHIITNGVWVIDSDLAFHLGIYLALGAVSAIILVED